jgi:hypothetical protein
MTQQNGIVASPSFQPPLEALFGLCAILINRYTALPIHPRDGPMSGYNFTPYFENEVLRKRPYLKKAWYIQVIEHPLKIEPQEGNRFRFWGIIHEWEGRVLRVITLEDKTTIHNAFPDRRFKP